MTCTQKLIKTEYNFTTNKISKTSVEEFFADSSHWWKWNHWIAISTVNCNEKEDTIVYDSKWWRLWDHKEKKWKTKKSDRDKDIEVTKYDSENGGIPLAICPACNHTDYDRMWVACEYCDQWYHADCIGYSEWTEEEISKHYVRYLSWV